MEIQIKPKELSPEEQRKMNRLTKELDSLFSDLNKKYCPKCTMCCCDQCGNAQGHFNTWAEKTQITPHEFIMKKFGYKKKTGFLTKTGCSIPREFRSKVCLRYTCHKFGDSATASAIVTGGIRVLNREHKLEKSECRYLIVNIVQDRIDKIVENIQKIRGW